MNIEDLKTEAIEKISKLPRHVFFEPIETVIKKSNQLGYDVSNIDDIRNLPIEIRDRIAKDISSNYQKWAVASSLPSIPGGVFSIPGLVGEIVGLSLVTLRSVSGIAIAYGFNPEDNKSDLVVSVGLASASELTGIIAGNFVQEKVIELIVRQIIKAIANKAPSTALAQSFRIIPFLGAGVCSFINYFAISGININAMNNFRSLALERNYNLSDKVSKL